MTNNHLFYVFECLYSNLYKIKQKKVANINHNNINSIQPLTNKAKRYQFKIITT